MKHNEYDNNDSASFVIRLVILLVVAMLLLGLLIAAFQPAFMKLEFWAIQNSDNYNSGYISIARNDLEEIYEIERASETATNPEFIVTLDGQLEFAVNRFCDDAAMLQSTRMPDDVENAYQKYCE